VTVTDNVETGLQLNTSKCQIILDDFTQIDAVTTFRDFIRVGKEEINLLGATVRKAK